MEAFDNNETGIMLWDPDDVLVYINKATQDFINSLGASITIGIKFEDFANNLLQIKTFSEEHVKRRKTTRKLARETNIPIIASGGVRGIKDIEACSKLAHFGIDGMIAGRALYDGRLSLREAIKVANQSNKIDG